MLILSTFRIPVPAAPCFPISDYWKAGKEILYKRALKNETVTRDQQGILYSNMVI